MNKHSFAPRWPLIGALLLGAFLFSFRLDPYLTDIDSWRQTETATMARNFLKHPNILFPRIAWGAPGPGIVESEFALYPWLVHLLYRGLGENPLYGRLLSGLFMLLALFNFSKVFQRVLPRRTADLATLILVTMPLFVRMGRAFMPEATAMFFFSFALRLVIEGIKDERRGRFFTAGFFLLGASLVKPTSLVLGLIVAVLVVLRWGVKGLFRWEVFGFGLVVLGPLAAFLVHAAHLHAEYGNTFGVLSGGDSKWGNLAMWMNYKFWGRLSKIEAKWVFGFSGFLLGALGALKPLKESPKRLLTVALLVMFFYLALVGRYSSFDARGSHYHLWITPFASASIAWGAALLWEHAKRQVQLAGTFLLLGVFAQNLWGTARLLDPGRPDSFLRQAGLAIQEKTTPDENIVVLSFDPQWDRDPSGKRIPNNFEMPNIFFHAKRNGRVLPRDGQVPARLESVLKRAHARFFVNIPPWNDPGDPAFRNYLKTRMRLVTQGKGFELWVSR